MRSTLKSTAKTDMEMMIAVSPQRRNALMAQAMFYLLGGWWKLVGIVPLFCITYFFGSSESHQSKEEGK